VTLKRNYLPKPMTTPSNNSEIHKMKLLTFVIVLLLTLAGCASMQPAPNLLPDSAPKLQASPAWILEPGPDLIKLLNELITPYATESTPSKESLRPAKAN